MAGNEVKQSRVLLAAVWLVVGVPGAWGVEQTFNKSLDLFRAAPAKTAAVTTQPSTLPAGMR